MQTINRFRQPLEVPIGTLLVTEAAQTTLSHRDILTAVVCQGHGSWGDVDDDEWRSNDSQLALRNRVRGVHLAETGLTFWIITDITRLATMIALPSDYE